MSVYPVLTTRQPWAWLILQNQQPTSRKNIENRSWKLPEKYHDTPVLVHTSAKPLLNPQACIHELQARSFICDSIQPHKDEATIALAGHIVGVVRFSNCFFNKVFDFGEDAQHFVHSGSRWCDMDSKFWWQIAKAKAITPVPAKGRLSFWQFDYPHIAELEGF